MFSLDKTILKFMTDGVLLKEIEAVIFIMMYIKTN